MHSRATNGLKSTSSCHLSLDRLQILERRRPAQIEEIPPNTAIAGPATLTLTDMRQAMFNTYPPSQALTASSRRDLLSQSLL